MDFAKRQLEKYGWKEGKGLGKGENGIAVALKPSLKFDSTGVGYEIGKDFTNKWWENVYDNAAKNVEVVQTTEQVKVKRIDDADEVEITTKDYSVKDFKKKNSSMEYGTFLKTAKLTQEGTVKLDNVFLPDEADKFPVKHLSDDDLFTICGGRTAHKGARHGLNQTGKLARIERQERLLMKKMQKVQLSEEPLHTEETCKKRLKKLRKISETLSEPEKCEEKETCANPEAKRKKKKKRNKSVSFSETVLEYVVQEPDDKGTPGSNAAGETVDVQYRTLSDDNGDEPVTTDEGIEEDCEVKSPTCDQEVFSEMQKKKKHKKSKSKQATIVEVEETEQADEQIVDAKKKKKKRRSKETTDLDIDAVGKIKKKKYQHKQVENISTSMEDLRI